MFTGIVEEVGRVTLVRSDKITVAASKVLQDIEPGGSVAVNGVCLTVTDFDTHTFSADVMPETLGRSNLGLLAAGAWVNLERPLPLGGRLGGHLVQGHVDATGRVASLSREAGSVIVSIEAPPGVMKYIARKGFIAVDGLSLTVVARDGSSFVVALVDYTRQHTTIGERRVGDVVNLEADIIAKYVEQLSQPHRPGITADFLEQHGFLVN